jgi:aspartate racemase
MPKERILGVIGGMGSEATAFFFELLVRQTPVEKDQEHLPLIILNLPDIPDRGSHILGQGESFLPHLVERARMLADMGCGIIAIPCNTAHYYWREIQDSVEVPVLNILSETVRKISLHMTSKTARIGIVATRGTSRAGLYQAELERSNLTPLTLPEDLQSEVQQSIQWIKQGIKLGRVVSSLQRSLDFFSRKKAHGVILGCTELTLVADQLDAELPLFDSLQILVESAIREVRGDGS